MSRADQEAVTTFAEVLSTAEVTYHHQQNCQATTDSRLIIYFQGMKVCIPDRYDQNDFVLATKKLLDDMRW